MSGPFAPILRPLTPGEVEALNRQNIVFHKLKVGESLNLIIQKMLELDQALTTLEPSLQDLATLADEAETLMGLPSRVSTVEGRAQYFSRWTGAVTTMGADPEGEDDGVIDLGALLGLDVPPAEIICVLAFDPTTGEFAEKPLLKSGVDYSYLSGEFTCLTDLSEKLLRIEYRYGV